MNLDELRQIIWGIVNNIARKCFDCNIDFTADEITLEHPKSREHGDWATNIALKKAKVLGFNNPNEFAQLIIDELIKIDSISSINVAGPGFINITLNATSNANIIKTILKEGNDYGKSNILDGKRINLEFVSANPTGPLHIGGVRWAAVGDSLARVLEFSGGVIEREYYFNDHGTQIDRFASSLYASANSLSTPENGYGGKYIDDIAKQIIDKLGVDAQNITLEQFRFEGIQIMFPTIKQSLIDFGVKFDRFFHEQSLYDDGKVNEAINELSEKGIVYEKDGAKWIATSKFGDDKDRVVIKSNGEEAYFAADIAYYKDKRTRCDLAIYMLGADHGGYVSRLYAVAESFGDKRDENIKIMIGQLVNLRQNGEIVRMSKRAGNIITIDDLVDVVGVDAARFSLVRSPVDSPLDLDLGVLSSNKMDNPVFYVQYAHARTCNVLRNYLQIYPNADLNKLIDTVDFNAFENDEGGEIFAKMINFSEVVKMSATLLEPHRVARYLEELAGLYHSWYAKHRVIGDKIEKEISDARILLNLSVKQILNTGLDLLGVSSPEQM